MQKEEILDVLIEALKRLGDTAIEKVSGHFFAGADMAIAPKDKNSQMYRIIVINKLQI